MKHPLQTRPASTRLGEHELAGALRHCLDKKYGQILQAARHHWERNFAGKDPSDACVTVRISDRALGHSRPIFVRALRYGL